MLDRPAGRTLSAVVVVLGALGQRERQSCVEARRHAGTNATDGYAVVDADPEDPCLGQRRLRLAAHDRGNP